MVDRWGFKRQRGDIGLRAGNGRELRALPCATRRYVLSAAESAPAPVRAIGETAAIKARTIEAAVAIGAVRAIEARPEIRIAIYAWSRAVVIGGGRIAPAPPAIPPAACGGGFCAQ